MKPAPHYWCASCQSAGVATEATMLCEDCNRWRCPAHVLTDPPYVAPEPVADQTAELFGPEPVL